MSRIKKITVKDAGILDALLSREDLSDVEIVLAAGSEDSPNGKPEGKPASETDVFNDDQWIRATILHMEPEYQINLDPFDTGHQSGIDRSKHQVPIRDAAGTLDAGRMNAAVGELMASDAPQEKVKRAAQELLRAFRQIDDNAPDRLLGLAGEIRNRYAEFSADEWAGVELAEACAVDLAAELSGGAGERKWKIPAAAKKAAQWALDLRKQSGENFGTEAGVRTARYLIENDEMDESWARKIRGYFKRHEKSPGEDLTDKTTNGGKSAGLWGGASQKRLTYGIANLAADDVFLTPVEFSALEPAALTPDTEGAAEFAGKGKAGFKRFWKNLLPVGGKVNYTYPDGTPAVLDFAKKNCDLVVKNFGSKAVGAVPFLMVNGKNQHSGSPELARGVISDMRVKGKHLQVLVEPRSKEAETFLSNFPEVGISAKYHPEFFRASDKRYFGPTVLHAAATWEPHVEGLGPFEQAAKMSGESLKGMAAAYRDEVAVMFSSEDEGVVDLSTREYETDQADEKTESGPTEMSGQGNQKGENVKFKEVRNGVLIFVDEEGNEIEVSKEDSDSVAAVFSASGESGGDEDVVKALQDQVAELSSGLAGEKLAREHDKIEHKLDRYRTRGVAPTVIARMKPLLLSAAATPDQTVEVVELSADGKIVAEKKQVSVTSQLWGILDHELEHNAVSLSSEQGVDSAESGGERTSESDRDAKVKARMKEASLSYGAAAAELAAQGEI